MDPILTKYVREPQSYSLDFYSDLKAVQILEGTTR